MAKQKITVKILDQEFVMATESSPEDVARIADYLNRHLKEILAKHKSLPTNQAVLLAAMNMTEKYFVTLEKKTELKARVTEKSRKVLRMIEQCRIPAAPSAD